MRRHFNLFYWLLRRRFFAACGAPAANPGANNQPQRRPNRFASRKRRSHFREAIFFLMMHGAISIPLLWSGRDRFQLSRDLLSEAR